ncbi:NUDIX domain-containing protein [Rhizobium giardinii]|uniref:8-oxo-dGTP pyrophosphatase MutT (NUDIX family) n=1 Tax=Rhizobium giardinii TaxID=56731 RepID=A0A7W8UE12_9HYPH|nr:NUDIX domain-containing protein [Rhizobium giardinii]MBB5537655.1 8-oxo-dGTP pyrophosphatase MutT (NUDIX family) [Rhizobium giardinii]
MTQTAMRIEIREDEAGFAHAERSAPLIEQAGAICLRKAGGREKVEVPLIGSLRNGRWGIPKGHVEPGETSRQAAEREAFEEAGIIGTAMERVVGSFVYTKDRTLLRYRVAVHLVHVKKDRRKIKWVPIDVGSQEVGQTSLGQIIYNLI